jgi:SAM-dependent methyltransferase
MSEATSVNLSTAASAFDRLADSYDDLFTRSSIGQAQRKQVWQRLLTAFAPGERILELNCGTGEDARFLAQRGRSIVACDASAKMIEVATARAQIAANGKDISFQQIANEDLDLLAGQIPFDGAYSNFSGLNCLEDLKPVARNLASLVRPGGRLLLCLWSRVCAGEIIWYLIHGNTRKALRRFSGQATVRLGELSITVSYPTVRKVRRVFAPWFELEQRSAIGLFVPPSYVEGWAQRHHAILGYLEELDRHFGRWPLLRDLGDHVLLEFTRCLP